MTFNLSFDPFQITEETELHILNDDSINSKAICIDKDSYIVNAKVITNFPKIEDTFLYNLQIGKYCSISDELLLLMNCNHDFKATAQGTFKEIVSRSDTPFIHNCITNKGELLIENDVWIGARVTLMSGITIHNGAVIAAGSVVTKDVPPYAIVGGNPAKIIGYRFEQDIIDKLLEISWWNFSPEELSVAAFYLKHSPEAFISKYYKESANNPVIKNRIQPDNYQYLAIIDNSVDLAWLNFVLTNFCKKYENTSTELMIAYQNITLEESIISTLNNYEDYECFVNLYYCEDFEDAIRQTDCYITNNSKYNLSRLEIAEKSSVSVMSGFNYPLFT